MDATFRNYNNPVMKRRPPLIDGIFFMIGIYKITSPSGKIYIGQSINIKKRIRSYRYSSNCKQRRLKFSFDKYGIDNHQFTIVEICSVDQLNERERYWQDFYNVIGDDGLNCVLQKSNNKSGFTSDETKSKISKSRKGIKSNYKNNYERSEKIRKALTGKKLSESHKISLSISHKGIKMKPENVEKLRLRMTGHKFNDDFKMKMSKIQTGGSNSFAKLTLNLSTGIYYYTAKEAAESLGWSYNRFNHYMNGRTSRKLPFSYV